MLQMTPENLAVYQTFARRQQEQDQQQLLKRQKLGWAIAQQAAQLLKSEFGANRVVLFGSLVQVERMHLLSDIDLAVWHLDEKRYLQAVAQLLDLSDFSVDLIEAEHAPLKLLNSIEATGVEL
jgi:uncharacterized protein